MKTVKQNTLPSIYTSSKYVYIEQCNYKALNEIYFHVTGDYYGKPMADKCTVAIFKVRPKAKAINTTFGLPIAANINTFSPC